MERQWGTVGWLWTATGMEASRSVRRLLLWIKQNEMRIETREKTIRMEVKQVI